MNYHVIADTHFGHEACIEWCGRPKEFERKILKNLSVIRPLPAAIVFDINCPTEVQIDRLNNKQTDDFERFITVTPGSPVKFRMTWQSHYVMTKKLLRVFSAYDLSIKFYDLKQQRHKVLYFLERR